MTLNIFNKTLGFKFRLFCHSGDTNFYGTAEKLLGKVAAYNKVHKGMSRVVVHSMYEPKEGRRTRVNIGVYGMDLEECKTVLNHFAKPSRNGNECVSSPPVGKAWYDTIPQSIDEIQALERATRNKEQRQFPANVIDLVCKAKALVQERDKPRK